MANDGQRQKTESRKEQFRAMAGLIGKFGAGAFAGPKSEKLTLSMNAAELEQVDALVEQGLYMSREDFLQSAARNLLHEHGMDLPQTAPGRLMAAGIVMHNRKSLENFLPLGGKLNST
jgi:Arc/MetJ-type ribon-helix-helix transcriptional regulator